MTNVTRQVNQTNPLVLVYGTLKKPYGNWKAFLDNNTRVHLMGTTHIPASAGFIMYDWGGFPIVQKRSEILSYLSDKKRADEIPTVPEATPIVCQLFRIDRETLDCLDGLEGHPNWYVRRTHPINVTSDMGSKVTEYGWIYVMPPAGNDNFAGRHDWSIDHVESGCWRPTDACVTYMADEGLLEESEHEDA